MKSVALLSVICFWALSLSALAQPPGVGGQGKGYGYTSPGNRFFVQRGVHFERYRDRDGYQLRIHTRGMDPEAIQVTVQGRSLVVQNRESHQLERRSGRGGYSFSTTSSSMRRRFPLPPDADAGAMKRSQEEGVVVITLPYAQFPRF
ncbi:MAG: Hsp20/alpha crystallin family protein [Candidatus Thiodiazotropha sp.]